MRNNVICWLFCCFVISSFFSCKEPRQREIERLMKEWYGKELFLPKGLTATVMGDSDVVYSEMDFIRTTKKIVFMQTLWGVSVVT